MVGFWSLEVWGQVLAGVLGNHRDSEKCLTGRMTRVEYRVREGFCKESTLEGVMFASQPSVKLRLWTHVEGGRLCWDKVVEALVPGQGI